MNRTATARVAPERADAPAALPSLNLRGAKEQAMGKAGDLVVVPQQDEVRVWKTEDGEVIIRVPRPCVRAFIFALQGLAKDGNG